MEMHNQLQHHHHHPKSNLTSSDFDSIFAGVSLQSLLLGEPVLLTPPPPPFPPSPHLPFPLPHHHHLGSPPPTATFSFRAAPPTPSPDKPRPHARRNQVAPPRPRRRTQKVSEKLKALRMIVPCDPKADIATMLEHAYKYVRYLEAQVLALLTMQLCTLDERGLCSGIASVGATCEIERRMIESVGMLSRKEVVEAVVNSGTAQKVMYEEGLCLVSEEQVRVLAWSAFQKQQQQQQQQLLSGLIGGAANVGNNNSSSSSCCYSYSPGSYSYS